MAKPGKEKEPKSIKEMQAETEKIKAVVELGRMTQEYEKSSAEKQEQEKTLILQQYTDIINNLINEPNYREFDKLLKKVGTYVDEVNKFGLPLSKKMEELVSRAKKAGLEDEAKKVEDLRIKWIVEPIVDAIENDIVIERKQAA